MFDSIFGVAGDVLRVVTAPIEIAADAAKAITQPLAEAAQEVVDSVKELKDD